MKYFQTKNGVTIDENRNIIPMDESNQIYQEYLKFLVNNGTVELTDMLSDFEMDLVKTEAIDKLKKECYDELALTDWYFIRKMDIGVEIPLEIIEQRNAIRERYNDLINKNKI
jgi:hypothetical protein